MASEGDDKGTSYPLEPIIYDKEKRSNLIHRSIRLERKSFSVYLSANVWEGWKTYCQHSPEDHAYLTEGAFIEYMQRHPISNVKVSISTDLAGYRFDTRDRLRNKILKDKIRNTIDTLKRLKELSKGDSRFFRRQLQKQILQATNLRRPDDELLSLMEEAESWI